MRDIFERVKDKFNELDDKDKKKVMIAVGACALILLVVVFG